VAGYFSISVNIKENLESKVKKSWLTVKGRMFGSKQPRFLYQT
jgi:hypothetical protein